MLLFFNSFLCLSTFNFEITFFLYDLINLFLFHVFYIFYKTLSTNRAINRGFEPILDTTFMKNMSNISRVILPSFFYVNFCIFYNIASKWFNMLKFIKFKTADSAIFIKILILWLLINICFNMGLYKLLYFWNCKATFTYCIRHIPFSIWMKNLNHLLTNFLISLLPLMLLLFSQTSSLSIFTLHNFFTFYSIFYNLITQGIRNCTKQTKFINVV